MTGAILQLVAIGYDNMFFTDKPEITFFKMVYRRHTNYAREQIPQFFTNPAKFGKTSICPITKNADLIGQIYLIVTLPEISLPTTGRTKFAWVKKIGFALIKSINIEINGKQIDKHYGEWLNLWTELTGGLTGNAKAGYKKMIGDETELSSMTYSKQKYKLYIPLYFWFCKSPGNSLPLISLQQSDITINVEFENADKCHILSPTHYIPCMDDVVNFIPFEYIEQNIDGDIRAGIFIDYDIETKRLYYYKITPNKILSIPVASTFDTLNTTLVDNLLTSTTGLKYAITGQTSKFSVFAQLNKTTITSTPKLQKPIEIENAFLLVDYYFLDQDERIKFAQAKHDYLIEEVFFTPSTKIDGLTKNIKIFSDHPCKMMVWIVQMDYIYNSKDYYNYTDSYKKNIKTDKLLGNKIITNSTILFNGNERLSYRDSSYFDLVQFYQHINHTPETGINMYSYCVYPLEYQPSGPCNTSQFSNIEAQLKLSNIVSPSFPAHFRAYSLCTNVLRIANGLGAKVFVK
jgi:hypothetical protein